MNSGRPRRQNRSRRPARAQMASRSPLCRVRPRQHSGTSCWPNWKGWGSKTWTRGHFRHGQRQTPWRRRMETRSDWRFKPGSAAYRRHRMRTPRQPNGTSQRRTKRSAPASTRACWQSPWRVACGTRHTCGSWPNSPASSAGASPATPTICGLRNPAVSASRSATNLPSRCAGHTIANCTAPARKSDWWAKAGLEPISLARKLWLETHPLHASADVLGDDSEKPGAANDEVTAMSRQQREPRMAKRTQLPGTAT